MDIITGPALFYWYWIVNILLAYIPYLIPVIVLVRLFTMWLPKPRSRRLTVTYNK